MRRVDPMPSRGARRHIAGTDGVLRVSKEGFENATDNLIEQQTSDATVTAMPIPAKYQSVRRTTSTSACTTSLTSTTPTRETSATATPLCQRPRRGAFTKCSTHHGQHLYPRRLKDGEIGVSDRGRSPDGSPANVPQEPSQAAEVS
jgi:hypothetical protein